MAEDVSLSNLAALRQSMKARRAALGAPERVRFGNAVAEHLFALPAVRRARRLAGYWAFGGELPLHAVHGRVRAPQQYFLPRLGNDSRLRFARWQPDCELTPNRYGIPEPDIALEHCLEAEALDVILLPLLAFDAAGHRLGMGAGWYDRTLHGHADGKPLLIGVGYAFQQVESIAAEPWDIPMHMVATEAGITRCRA